MNRQVAMKLEARLAKIRIGRTGPTELGALVVVGLFMAAVGAFGDDGSLLARYIYWQVVMVGGGVVGAMIEPLLWKVPALARRPALLAVAQMFAMTPPVTLLVWLVSALVFGIGASPFRYLLLLPAVFIVDVGVVLVAWLIRRGARPMAAPGPAAGAPPPAIREKLPPKLARGELLAVESEDHYLRIHTSAGDVLILMRLTDALEALKDAPGLRVHRSWWVARRAVETARFNRGRGELTLSNGLKAPVSRAYVAQVRATDWAV